MKKSELKHMIREELEALSELSTLGVSGMKAFAKKHGFSVKSKKSGGRVPYITLTKDGNSHGPFDPSITTKAHLHKKIGISEHSGQYKTMITEQSATKDLIKVAAALKKAIPAKKIKFDIDRTFGSVAVQYIDTSSENQRLYQKIKEAFRADGFHVNYKANTFTVRADDTQEYSKQQQRKFWADTVKIIQKLSDFK